MKKILIGLFLTLWLINPVITAKSFAASSGFSDSTNEATPSVEKNKETTVSTQIKKEATSSAENKEPVKKSGFLDAFIKSLKSIFTGSADSQATSSAETSDNFTKDKEELLKTLNHFELKLRKSVTGKDIYLKREIIIDSIAKFKAELSTAGLEKSQETIILDHLNKIEKTLNQDLVEGPQDKIKPLVLDALDVFEALTFELSDSSASKLLELVKKYNLN